MKFIKLLLPFFAFSFAYAQKPEIVFERLDSTHVQLYFNEQYWLTDKNCEFKSIRRVVNIDKDERLFNGEFSDYDNEGRVILTGIYRDGKKEGTFKAFFPGGYLKWHGNYKNNEPVGPWYYYYPDGKPKVIIEYTDGQAYITEFWNEKGIQTVKGGNGKFVLDDPAYGFNEHGYRAIRYSGKVKDELPDGTWEISYLFRKAQPLPVAAEVFNNGTFSLGFNNELKQRYSKSLIQFAPSEYFANAENTKSIKCLVDDQLNFTVYLGNYLNKRLKLLRADTLKPTDLELTLQVDELGRSSGIRNKTPLNGEFNAALYNAILSVNYWIPSQKAGKIIPDNLTIRVNVSSDASGSYIFALPIITREKGT